jgi:hypothetical protein
MIHTGGVFINKKYAEECFTHDFAALVKFAGLTPELKAALAANPAFVGLWGTAILWKETSRYEQKGQSEADALYLAITDNPNGACDGYGTTGRGPDRRWPEAAGGTGQSRL